MSNPTLSDVTRSLPGYDPGALPVAHAQQIITQFVQPVQGLEQVSLHAAMGRVLAHDIISPISVPAHDNSAMDGYAFAGTELKAGGPITLQVVGTAMAGKAFPDNVQTGQCVRIMTGAVMPAGCDTVVPQELTLAVTDTTMTLAEGAVQVGDNRRLLGEDLMRGQAALHAGRIVHASDLGLLASLGIAEITVRRRVRVAFFSTGDELRSVGEPLDVGCVYDSNRYTLFGMLTRLGCELIDMGVVQDNPQALEAAFHTAAERADAIITSGGVSVGAADYTKQTMAKLGDVNFWKIGMRPGRPMAFGSITANDHPAYVFGLPGNPVAVMVTFYFFARDALLRMMGASAQPLLHLQAVSQTAIRKKPGRTEYQRGVVFTNAQGQPAVRITGSQGSGVLRSMSEANAMVVLGHDTGDVKPGDWVPIVVFDGLC